MTTVLAPPVFEGPRRTTGAPAPRFTRTATLLGLFGFLVSFAGSWQPSYWGDEAASVMSAERPLGSLFRMLGHVDAVHGSYYLFLHAWIDLFGASEASTRLPSALAIGVATAGTAVLARQVFTARVAVVAALVFAVLPRVTYMGAEARSTALATMIAVWLTVLLVHTVRSEEASPALRWTLWAGYAVLLAGGVYMFLYVVLLIPVHALAVLLLLPKGTRVTGSFRAWLGAVAAGLLLAAPVLYWGLREHKQIAFIGRRPQIGLLDAMVRQWFGTVPFAVLAWALVALAVIAVFGLRTARDRHTRSNRAVLAILLAWMIVPSATLFLGTRLVAPMYALRYLSICTPAVAIVVAVGITGIRPSWLSGAALLLVGVLVLPGYLAQRSDYGKDLGSDWRQAAAVVQGASAPGDAVVFDESVRPSQRPRLALHLYPDAFRGLRDVMLARPYQRTIGLWDTTAPLGERLDRLAATHTVWVLQNTGSSQTSTGTDVGTLQQRGFRMVRTIPVNRTIIIEMTR